MQFQQVRLATRSLRSIHGKLQQPGPRKQFGCCCPGVIRHSSFVNAGAMRNERERTSDAILAGILFLNMYDLVSGG